MSAATIAIASAAPEHRAPHPIGEERHGADENGDEDHDTDVAVANVRQLVRDHSLELGAVELVEKAARDRDRCVLRVPSGRERVWRGIFDQVDLRRRNAEPESQRLDHVPEAQILVRAELARLALREDQLVPREVRHERAAARDREREGKCRDPTARREVFADHVRQHGDEGREHRDQEERAPAIGRGRLVDRKPRG